MLQGSVLRCEVQGKLVMKAFLSGMPDIKLGLNDKLEVGSGGGWVAYRGVDGCGEVSAGARTAMLQLPYWCWCGVRVRVE